LPRSQPLALTSLLPQGARAWFPSVDSSHAPPCSAVFFVKGERPRTHSSKRKTMKTKIQNSDSRLKNRIAQRKKQLPRIDFALRRANRKLQAEKLLTLLRVEAPNLFDRVECVGKWLWIRFEAKQPSSVTRLLSEFGFHWNHFRQCWQNPCSANCEERATYDPRCRYGSYFPADIMPN
jgi:hypothetical protein